jgi:hypothetical protein
VSQNPWKLEDIQIASPCPKSWHEMEGDNCVRHCPQCNHNVYNFAGMTRAEIETLLRKTEGRLCARFYRREDGRIMTSDCPQPLSQPVRFWAKLRTRFSRRGMQQSLPTSLGGPPILTGIVARPTPWDANHKDDEGTK